MDDSNLEIFTEILLTENIDKTWLSFPRESSIIDSHQYLIIHYR